MLFFLVIRSIYLPACVISGHSSMTRRPERREISSWWQLHDPLTDFMMSPREASHKALRAYRNELIVRSSWIRLDSWICRAGFRTLTQLTKLFWRNLSTRSEFWGALVDSLSVLHLSIKRSAVSGCWMRTAVFVGNFQLPTCRSWCDRQLVLLCSLLVWQRTFRIQQHRLW